MADPERADPIPTDDQWLMTEMMNSVDIDKLGGVDDKVDRSQAGPPKDFDRRHWWTCRTCTPSHWPLMER